MFNQFQIKHNAVDSLLNILRENGHPELPKTARTLLATCDRVDWEVKSGMKYIYMGCKEQLIQHLKMYPSSVLGQMGELDISLNIDGLPIFKSSNHALWPVLCKINLSPPSVFPFALCYGASKPKNLEFLEEVVRDLHDLMENGLEVGSKNIRVTLRCVTCDAPAKALVKNIKQYSGYYGCDKCDQKGLWDGHRVVYSECRNLSPRTDESFRGQTQEEHHLSGESPFCQLSVDMIEKFSADYMHQCCLGVMRKLILLWLCGPKGIRLSSSQIKQVSDRLVVLRQCIPNVFARKPRCLGDIDRWKATELRQFALYTGKIVLKGVLPDKMYHHFLAFSVALCILVSPGLAREYNSYASELLTFFVEQGRALYGSPFLVYNVHSMVHLAYDVGL